MTPIFIDVEASGFGRGSYPIEAGLALPDGNPKCFLITPPSNWTHWDPQAEKIHGISRQTLLAHGSSVQDVAEQLNRLLAGQTVYSDAWSFDMSWLGKLFDQAEMLPQYRIASLAELLSPDQLAQWDSTKRQVAREFEFRRHRASVDALILQQTYLRIAPPPLVDDRRTAAA